MLAEIVSARTGGRLTLLRIALLLTAVLYLPSLNFHFVYDDLPQIVFNPRLRGLDSLFSYFTSSSWGSSQTIYQYRPLFLAWLWLNHALFGLNPLGWHATTIAAHLTVVWLVHRLVLSAAENEDVAGLAAIFFGLHPAHMETATWISAVSESLYAIPALGATIFYIRFARGQRYSDLAGASGLFLLALFCKETALSLLLILAACQLLYGTRSSGLGGHIRALSIGMAPLLALAAMYLLVRSRALQAFTHFPFQHSWMDVLATWPAAIWFYAKTLCWPLGARSQFYDIGFTHSINGNDFWLPLLGAALLTGALLRSGWQNRDVAFGALWLIPLLPPLAGIYSFGEHDVVHDRYLYLPVLTISVLLALAICYGMQRVSGLNAGARALPILAALGIVVGYSYNVAIEQTIYRDDVSLYGRGTEVAPAKATVWNYLGYAEARDGRRDEAIRAHHRALDLQPDDWTAHGYLGDIYFEAGDLPQAEEHLRQAANLRTGPAASLLWNKLGLSLARMQQYSAAEDSFRRAIDLAPTRAAYHFSLGQSLRSQGRFAEAAEEFRREIALNGSGHAIRALQEMKDAAQVHD